MLQLQQILHLLEETAARFPVEQWKLGRLHVWPLVRYEIANRNFELTARPLKMGARPALFRRLASWQRAGWQWPRPAEVVVYSDGVSYLSTTGGAYDRFADPVQSLAQARNLRTTVVTPHDRFIVGQAGATLVQPLLDGVQLFAAATSRLPVGRASALPGFQDAVHWWRSRGAHHLPTLQSLARTVHQIEVHAAAMAVLLRYLKPQVALLPSYIGTERFAFVVACRRLGIASVDIQHGAAGDTHWAYGGFGRAPDGGYEMLPSRFWCWSQSDADSIRRWAAGSHQAIVGGIPMLEAWRLGAVPGVEQARLMLAARCLPTRPQVLIVLSGFETPELLRSLVRAVEQAPDWFFWFRTHPMRPQRAAELVELLAASDVGDRAEVQVSSVAPLFALLERVRAVVMELSSTAYEAAQFNVPSVLLSASNADVYADLKKRGLLVFAPVDELVGALRSLVPPQAVEMVDPSKGIDALLAC